MSDAAEVQSREPRTRYDGGFDRWDRNSRIGWSVLWRASENLEFALGQENTVWVWDDAHRIWKNLRPEEQRYALREHELTLRQLRRAMPVLRLFLDGAQEMEREAAREALNRLGSAIVTLWHENGASDRLMRGDGWIDHPAAIYRAIARDCAEQLPANRRIPYDQAVFAHLVATAEADHRAGRRVRPPRLRDVDLLELPDHPLAAPPPQPGPKPKPAAADPDDAARPAETVDLSQLRDVFQEEVTRREQRIEAWQNRGRKTLPWAIGLFAASLVLALVRAIF
jgi:hypothetical protein